MFEASQPTTRPASRPALRASPCQPTADLARAAMLDRLADAELQQGHHEAGERLSHLALEVRARARAVRA